LPLSVALLSSPSTVANRGEAGVDPGKSAFRARERTCASVCSGRVIECIAIVNQAASIVVIAIDSVF
jgi:hypothetical protein